MELTDVLALVYFLCSAGLLSQQYLSKCDLNDMSFCSPVLQLCLLMPSSLKPKQSLFRVSITLFMLFRVEH